MFKKIAAIILLAIMTFSIAACASEPISFFPEEDPASLKQVKFRWGNYYYSQYYPTEGETVIGDALLARYKEMEEKYDMIFIVENMANDSAPIMARMAISQDVPDLFMGTSRKVGWALYNANALYSLDEIETIDSTSEKWGAKNFISCTKYNGKEYGFFPWEWAYAPNYIGIMLFNTALLNEGGVALPYEYQENGTWNWANFETVLKTLQENMTHISGFVPWDTGSYNDDGYYILMANGLSAVEKDENGKIIFGYDCTAGQDALNFLNRMYTSGLYSKSKVFSQGLSAFYTTGVSEATSVVAKSDGTTSAAAAGFEYGLVTIPYGPNGNKDTVSANVYWSTPMNFILNQSENDAPVIGAVMEELFRPLDNVSDWREYCQEFVFFHPEDYNNYIYMLENCNYDYSIQLGESSNLDGYFGDVVLGNISAAEAFEAVRDAANAAIAENVKTLD